MASACNAPEFNMHELPPLPSPLRKVQRRQEMLGCALVLSITTFLVGATHAVSCIEELSFTFVWTCRGCIYAEAVLAVLCLIGLMLADPGIVQRSTETCLPMPEHVGDMILRGERCAENVVDGASSFCVRCLVWRHPEKMPGGFLTPLLSKYAGLKARPHHCSICQRCVMHFDHHCGVFGRCIAAGNIGFFYGLICLGSLGGLTWALATVLALSLTFDAVREKPEIYVPICVLVALYCCRRPLQSFVLVVIRYCAMKCKLHRAADAANSSNNVSSST
eukprot:symbB.v1.2.038938.t1/scaffold6249.1/size19653/4